MLFVPVIDKVWPRGEGLLTLLLEALPGPKRRRGWQAATAAAFQRHRWLDGLGGWAQGTGRGSVEQGLVRLPHGPGREDGRAALAAGDFSDVVVVLHGVPVQPPGAPLEAKSAGVRGSLRGNDTENIDINHGGHSEITAVEDGEGVRVISGVRHAQ